MKWRWVSKSVVLAIHNEQLAEHGGGKGVRDEGLLESALDRARNVASYNKANVYKLAASYAFGIVHNHPFVDGNKRIGFVVAVTFLLLNGYELTASEEEVVITILKLAAGNLTEKKLSFWFEEHTEKREGICE